MAYTCKCGQDFDLVAFLDALPPGQMGSSGMFGHACSRCGERFEGRLRGGGFDVGYTYWAGSMHFETVQQVRVAGLKLTRSEPDDLKVVIGSRHWHFGIRHPSAKRFVIFDQAFANGKRIGELDFAQWNVSVTEIEREAARLPPGPDVVLAAGDFLCLVGPEPALNRAWHYLNDGKSKKP